MMNECRQVCNVYNGLIIVLIIWITIVSICDIISNDKLNKLIKRIDVIEQIKQNSSLIEVNDELIDVDDYYQTNLKS